jgi:hypothetical protein
MPERRFYIESRPPVGEMSWWLVFRDDRLEVQKRWTMASDDGDGIERYEVSGFLEASTEPAEARSELKRLFTAFLSRAE